MGTGRSGLPRGVRDVTKAVQNAGDFRVFPSKASGGFTYEDDSGETSRFFLTNSNVQELYRQMDSAEKDAFDDWTSGTFMGFNSAKFSELPDYAQNMLRIYDKYMDKATLDTGVAVRRLASFSLINNGSRDVPDWDKLKNQLVTIHMPLSAAAAAQGLTIGRSVKNVEYIFHIPGGSTGAGMWIGDRRINPGWDDKQREYMINRDTVYKQGGYRYDAARGVYEVDLYYVGRYKHKYK